MQRNVRKDNLTQIKMNEKQQKQEKNNKLSNWKRSSLYIKVHNIDKVMMGEFFRTHPVMERETKL